MELKDQLLNLKMVIFGGKGGVGKTTCAASSAIWAAEQGRNTLVISTDPAHSLGDSLGIELPPGIPTPIEGIKNLSAMEINPRANMAEFQGITNVNPMENMGMPGMMDSMPFMDDMQEFSTMSPPGIDEALAFGKVLEFIETEHEYDLIIFDTAPTGHTLRFLSLPETLSGWIGKLLKLKIKIGKLFGKLGSLFIGKKIKKDNSMELLERLNDAILNAREDLVDPEINSFVIVMIPEEMAIAETGRLINELIKYRIPSSTIVINQVYTDTHELCDFCKSRRDMQQRNITRIKEIFQNRMGKDLIEVPLFKEEIRVYPKLKEFGNSLIKND